MDTIDGKLISILVHAKTGNELAGHLIWYANIASLKNVRSDIRSLMFDLEHEDGAGDVVESYLSELVSFWPSACVTGVLVAGVLAHVLFDTAAYGDLSVMDWVDVVVDRYQDERDWFKSWGTYETLWMLGSTLGREMAGSWTGDWNMFLDKWTPRAQEIAIVHWESESKRMPALGGDE